VNRGVPPLSRLYPTFMKILGGTFAVLFIVFRIIIWPYACYFFWTDMIELISSGKAHSLPVCALFMVVNAGLTILQFVWLQEILSTAVKVLSGKGDLSIDRGDGKKEN
jgi:TLC domain